MSRLTLEDATLHELALDLVEPLITSRGSLSSRDIIVLEATFAIDGATYVGFGEAAPMPSWGTEAHEASRRALDSLEPGATFEPLQGTDFPDSFDAAPTARFALELAALDAASKAADVPLATLLAGDGPAAAEVMLNTTIGATDPEEAAKRAVDAVDNGFRCLKMKVGVGPLQRELEAVSRIRDVVGDTIAIRLDANGAWSEQHALGALQAFAPYSIQYLEQPVAADALDALGRLSGATSIRVAADESVASPARASRLIDEGLVDVIVLKPMALGGLVIALDLAERAHEAGIGVTFTSFIESAVGRAGVAHAAASRPWLRGAHGIATGAWLATDVADSPDPIVDGAFQLDNTPGLGCALVLAG